MFDRGAFPIRRNALRLLTPYEPLTAQPRVA